MKYAVWNDSTYIQLPDSKFKDSVDKLGKNYKIYDVTKYTDAGLPVFEDKMEDIDRAKELAEAHWSYIEELLCVHGSTEVAIDVIGFHYVSAFVHGYKHALEDVTDASAR